MQTSFKITFLILGLCFFIIACQDSKSQQVIRVENAEETPTPIDSTIITSTEKEVVKNYELPGWPVSPKETKDKLYPFDEASKDAGFVKFRQRFYNAVNEKDITFLLTIISDSIFFSYGGEAGRAAFIKSWNLDSNPDESGIWKELSLCLELGGKFNNYDNQIRFVAPYVHMVETFEDPFEEGVIIGDNVRLRDRPGANAKIIGALSWDHFTAIMQRNPVEEEINGETYNWVHIKTLNGKQGYVYGKYTRFPIDYRVGFTKQQGDQWQMEYFIAGD